MTDEERPPSGALTRTRDTCAASRGGLGRGSSRACTLRTSQAKPSPG